VLVTGGFSGALGLAIRGLQLGRKGAWVEDPGFPLTRTALGSAGMPVTAVPVDEEGLDVSTGVQRAAGAALAVVTPGQQAPLGMTMSLPRRLGLLAWARRNEAWIIEDDYLSELQLKGRGGSGSCIPRSWRTGAAHRQFQQNDQPGAAPRFHGGAARTFSSVR
jgi:GntR family transcriptional regulator / MocR family aminotransferase